MVLRSKVGVDQWNHILKSDGAPPLAEGKRRMGQISPKLAEKMYANIQKYTKFLSGIFSLNKPNIQSETVYR